MSRKSKMDNASKLINIICELMGKQEKLLQHIGDLEDYVDALECMNDIEEGEELIMFAADEDFKDMLDGGLTKDQKERLTQIKKDKEEAPPLHSMEDILKIFEDDKDKP